MAGDGERATPALIAELAAGRTPGAIPGVVRRVDGRRVLTPPGGEGALDSLPPVHMHRWLDLKRYERRGGTVPIQTKRGCVFKCIYCTYLNVEGWGYRLREPELVADEIAELATRCAHPPLRVRRLHLQRAAAPRDGGVRGDRAPQAARASRHHELHPRHRLSPSCSRHAHTPGFKWLGITAESASDPVLEKLQKGFDVAQLRKVAENVERAGMGVLWIFLIGGPGETPATLEETLKFAAWRMERGDAVYLTVGLRVYPGTTLHNIAMDEGVVPRGDPLLVPKFYFSDAAAHGGDARAPARVRRALSAVHVLRGLALAAAAAISRGSRPRCGCRARTGATWAYSSGSAARLS